jgi:hypothetical protein
MVTKNRKSVIELKRCFVLFSYRSIFEGGLTIKQIERSDVYGEVL